MASTHLVSCPSCSRHVRARELACPFCQTALSEALRATPAPRRPGQGLSRMALATVGASALLFASACSNADTTSTPAYGGSPIPAGCEFPSDLVLGGACKGDVYVPATTQCGYLVCDQGAWTYDDDLPSGYTLAADAGDDSGDDAGDDASDDAGDDAATDAGDDAANDAADAATEADAGS